MRQVAIDLGDNILFTKLSLLYLAMHLVAFGLYCYNTFLTKLSAHLSFVIRLFHFGREIIVFIV